MASSIDIPLVEFTEHTTLYESKSFQQARERTFLQWNTESYPCRMKMKEAGWFIVRNQYGELISVCLYCKKGCKGWTNQHDPYKVHESLSPKCAFILSSHIKQTPSSPIIEFLPRHEQVRPSSDRMAILPERIKSFEKWPFQLSHTLFNNLVEIGLFYTGQNTIVRCFSCQGEISITNRNINPMLAHTDRCKYAKQLRICSQRIPLDIRASEKIYALISKQVNNIIFYFLQCNDASKPGILLSAIISHSYGQQLEILDKNFKYLRPTNHLGKQINWETSSDGPLVNILKDLANNNILDLTTISNNLKYLKKDFPLLSINSTNDFSFQCKTCLVNESSPHIVSIKCFHLGLCSKECFTKWMTCVVCGYTLGRTIRIYGV